MIIPPGFRFCPTDEELIYYLRCKMKGLQSTICEHIEEVDVYNYSPMELSAKYKLDRETEWYFYTPRTKKYCNGGRPNRFTKDGFWKATAGGKPVVQADGTKVGLVRTLCYRIGFQKDKNDKKTDWLMHEYTLDNDTSRKMEPWVLVKIYRKRGASNNSIQAPLYLGGPPAPVPSLSDPPHFYNHRQLQLPSPTVEETQRQEEDQPPPPQPIQVVEPDNQPPLMEYCNNRSLPNYSNCGFNFALNARENQPISTPEPRFNVADQMWSIDQLMTDPKPPDSENQEDLTWLDDFFDFSGLE